MHIAPPDRRASPPSGAEAVPDSAGENLWRNDPAFARLLPLYLPADLLDVLLPRLDRLGALAGGELDRLAGVADRNPPELRHRTRRGEDAEAIDFHPAYREMERIAFGEFGLAAMSHRAGVLRLAGAAAAGGEVRDHLPLRAGRVRPALPGQHDRQPGADAPPLRRPGAGGALPAAAGQPGPRRAAPGRDVHDRAGRRLRHRGDGGDGRAAGGRHLGAQRRQVVLLQRRCGTGAGAGADARAGRRGSPASRCSCCRAPCPTARPTRSASCG